MSVFPTTSIEETRQLGKKIASTLAKGDCVLLKGDLGAGKTELARAIIRALCRNEEVEVTSPTFTLAQDYMGWDRENNPVAIWHYDLYRIEREEELAELALEETLESSIVLVEWPSKAHGFLWPQHLITIRAKHGAGEMERIFHVSGML